jgi:hypothetical protein
MRFMMITKGPEQADSDAMPDAEGAATMMKYMESLEKAGVLLAFDGLRSPAMGAHVSFSGGKPVVTDGPFAEAKEVIGGYWMIQVNSKEEAIEWAKRCPAFPDFAIEIRQVVEFSDFPADVRAAAAIYPRLKAQCRNRPAT